MYVALSSVASKQCCPLDSTLGRTECSPVHEWTLNVARSCKGRVLARPPSPCPRAFSRGFSSSGAVVQAGGTRGQLGTDAFCDSDKRLVPIPVSPLCEAAHLSSPLLIPYAAVVWGLPGAPSRCAALSLLSIHSSLGWGQPSLSREEFYQIKLVLPHLRKNGVSLECASVVAW